MQASRILPFLAAVLTAVGCSSSVVNTKDAAPPTETQTTPTSTARPSNENLVNAFDYYVTSDATAGYYFVTPSGSWRCVIVPLTWVGCQSANSPARIGIAGAPQTVTDDKGQSVAPNAIVAKTMGDPGFASMPAAMFKPPTGTAKTLPYNKILAAAGFRCNISEQAGVSCLSEEAENGFTFAADKVSWQYTDLP